MVLYSPDMRRKSRIYLYDTDNPPDIQEKSPLYLCEADHPPDIQEKKSFISVRSRSSSRYIGKKVLYICVNQIILQICRKKVLYICIMWTFITPQARNAMHSGPVMSEMRKTSHQYNMFTHSPHSPGFPSGRPRYCPRSSA